MVADPRFLPGLVLVAFVAAAVFVTLLVAGVSRPGPRRAGLISGGLPLALLPPVAAAAYASAKLVGLFGGMAGSGGTGMRMLVDVCAALWVLQRMAWGVFAGTCVLGFLLGLVRSGRPADDVPCSGRRGLVLVLLPVLGLLVASTVTREIVKALRVTTAVMSAEESDHESRKRSDAVLHAEGLATQGAGSIAAISRFVARATMLGAFGGATAAVILLGLALPGLILAWRVRFGVWFLAFASVLWLLGAAGGSLVTFGVLNPLPVP